MKKPKTNQNNSWVMNNLKHRLENNMQGHWFEFENRQIYLDENEMFQVHEYYVVQRNADYFRDNFPHLAEEDKIMEMAWEWRDKELQEGYSNEDALSEVLEEFGLLDDGTDDDDDDDYEEYYD